MRARGPGARPSRAALQGEHRLPAGDAPGDARELPRVAERLEVEDDEARLVLVLPVLEQVVGRDVGLVADGHERREPQPACARRLEQREPEGAALGREADRAGRERLPGERRVDARRGHGEPEAVRAEQAGAVGANERQQPLLSLGALAAHLGEAGGQHAEGPRPPLERLAGNLEHRVRRHADHGQIDGLGQLGGGADRADAAHSRSRSVHGVGAPGEAALDEVAEHRSPDRALPCRRTDHGDALGPEERLERGDDGLVVAAVDVLAVALGRHDREQRPRPIRPRASASRRSRHPRRRRAWHGSRPGPPPRSSRCRPTRPWRRAARAAACRRPCPAARPRPRTRPRPSPDRGGAPSWRPPRSAPRRPPRGSRRRCLDRRRPDRGTAPRAAGLPRACRESGSRGSAERAREKNATRASASPARGRWSLRVVPSLRRTSRVTPAAPAGEPDAGPRPGARLLPRLGRNATQRGRAPLSAEGTITTGQRACWAHCWLTEPSRRP